MDNTIVWGYLGHEPSYHLKRMNSAPSLFALGESADEWQERLRSEECIKNLYNTGINVIYTNFFKGFGLEYEKDEIELTKELVKLAHKYNIKVLGYCQLKSLYYETFLAEDADVADMAAKRQDGKPLQWLKDTYYRWSTCYNSEKFLNYIKKVIDYGLDYVGLDGFHFDNSYISECFCENCRNDFRKYLKRTIPNPTEIMGINTFDYIEIPTYEEKPSINFDPLYFLWQKYRQEKCSEFHLEIFKHTKNKSNNKALILHNPAFPRASVNYVNRGYNPGDTCEYCDFVMAENFDNLVNVNGNTTTQILAYKFAQRFGYKLFESSWRAAEKNQDSMIFDTARYPETYFQISYYLSQSMILGGITGTPWLMRSTHIGNGMLFDFPLQKETHRHIISYFKKHSDMYGGKATNSVKLLYSPDNLLNMCSTGFDIFKDVANRIHNANIPFSLIIKDDILHLDKNQVIVVPELFFTDNEIRNNLEQAAKRGCKVIILGKYDVCNIYGKKRDVSKNTGLEKLFIRSSLSSQWETDIKEYAKIAIDISEPNIVSEVEQDADGNILVHLLSTVDREPTKLSLKLNGFNGIESVSAHSFEDVKLSFSAKDNTIEIDKFRIMVTLKMKLTDTD